MAGPLESLMVAAVLGAKTRKGKRDGKMQTFNSLLMRFGQMKPGFQLIKNLFQQLAVPSSMRITSLESRLDILKINKNSEIIKKVIEASKLEGKGGIDGDE